MSETRPMGPDEVRWLHALRARFDGLSFVEANVVRVLSKQFPNISSAQAEELRSIAGKRHIG